MKKILVLLMISVLTFSLFVGCGKDENKAKTSEELFDQMIEVSKTVNNAEFNANFDLEVSGLEALGFAGPMGLELSGQKKDQKNMKLSASVDTGQGMIIEADMYLSEEKVLVYAPLLQMVMGTSYLEMNMTDLEETAGVVLSTADPEMLLAVIDRFEAETEYSLYDILVLSDEMQDVEVTINDKKVDTTKLVMTVELEGAVDIINAFMTFVVNDAEASELFFSQYSEEDLAMLKEGLDDPEVRAEIEKALEMLTINKFEVSMYLNGDAQTVKTELTIDVTVDVDGVATTVKLNGNFDMFNFGGVKAIEFPEVNPDEVLNMNDMF